MKLEPENIPLQFDANGVIRVSGTRVSIDSLLYSFLDGASPETIADQFTSVPLADVYLVVGFYLKNRDALDAYLQDQSLQEEQIQRETEKRFSPHGIRARLLARHAASA